MMFYPLGDLWGLSSNYLRVYLESTFVWRGHQRMAERIGKPGGSEHSAFTESPAGGRGTSITITLHNLINLSCPLRWVAANPEQSLGHLGYVGSSQKLAHVGNHWNIYITTYIIIYIHIEISPAQLLTGNI